LAQWTIIDFATAVAMGAIIGRTAVASNQSYVVGAAAVVTLVAVHRLASLGRFNSLLGKLADHRLRILVEHGELRRTQLRRCGLTDNDLFAQLRQQGIFSLDGVRYVIYETKGSITVVPEDLGSEDPPLVEIALRESVGYPADP
jgi:uncharacterized membrane protein YcaP (DUF421 family)